MTAARVLLVDDDDLHREMVADYLALGGFEVRQALDGQEALRVLEREPPALVVLDLQMPTLDGVGVLQAMRAVPALAAIPVIVLSAVDATHVRIRALELGADDYVSKTAPPAELVARIRASLRRRATRPTVPPVMAGRLGAGLGLADVVQTLAASGQPGRLTLDELPAAVWCAGGAIVDARCRAQRGQAALERIVLAAHGRFAVELGPALSLAADGPARPLSLLSATIAVDEARRAIGLADAAALTLADGVDGVDGALARRRALFPLTVVELLLALDGPLAAAGELVAAALAAGHLIPTAPVPEVS